VDYLQFWNGATPFGSKKRTTRSKSTCLAGVFNVFTLIFAYIAGISMRKLMPNIEPDLSFITILIDYFPVGIRGLLIVGIMAALLSTIDGLLSSSSTLLNLDIYSRFIKKNATDRHLRNVAAIIQLVIVGIVLLIIPAYLDSGNISHERSEYEVLNEFLGSIMGVLIAIFVLGIFFKRTTAKASFIAMLIGIALGFYLLNFTDINFAHVGTIQFITVMVLGLLGSMLESKQTDEELKNLTIWTLEDVKGPWVGLKSWPGLWKWAIALPISWLVISILWETYMRS
jgi:SSS family solute:Na+ symporter